MSYEDWRLNMRFLSAFPAVMMGCATAAWAGAPQPFSDTLTLDRDGIRGSWLDEGIDFRIGYVSETATNVQGGAQELARYTDQITFTTTLDLEKILDFHHAQFKMTITDRNGDNLSTDANLQTLQ